MHMFIRDAGVVIWPVLVFGLLGLALVAWHAAAPRRDRLTLIVGVAIATLLFGVLGTVLGIQVSASAGGEFFLEGVRESLNNAVAALVFATLHTLGATYGTYRLTRQAAAAA